MLYLNLVDFESKSVIVRSDNVFFSQRLDNNCSDISVGKKASGCLKLSLVAKLGDTSFDNVRIVVVVSELLSLNVQLT